MEQTESVVKIEIRSALQSTVTIFIHLSVSSITQNNGEGRSNSTEASICYILTDGNIGQTRTGYRAVQSLTHNYYLATPFTNLCLTLVEQINYDHKTSDLIHPNFHR